MAIQCGIGSPFDQFAGNLTLLGFTLNLFDDGLGSRCLMEDTREVDGLGVVATILEKTRHGILGIGIVGVEFQRSLEALLRIFSPVEAKLAQPQGCPSGRRIVCGGHGFESSVLCKARSSLRSHEPREIDKWPGLFTGIPYRCFEGLLSERETAKAPRCNAQKTVGFAASRVKLDGLLGFLKSFLRIPPCEQRPGAKKANEGVLRCLTGQLIGNGNGPHVVTALEGLERLSRKHLNTTLFHSDLDTVGPVCRAGLGLGKILPRQCPVRQAGPREFLAMQGHVALTES